MKKIYNSNNNSLWEEGCYVKPLMHVMGINALTVMAASETLNIDNGGMNGSDMEAKENNIDNKFSIWEED
jgi:hypothetical protein